MAAGGGIFEPIELEWNGEKFVIQSTRVMGAIARIEEIITIKELHDDSTKRGTVRLVKLSQAYGSVLRYAGSSVTDEEVYAGMFGGGEQTAAEIASAALNGLIGIMVPPGIEAAVPTDGERKPPRKKTTPAAAAS